MSYESIGTLIILILVVGALVKEMYSPAPTMLAGIVLMIIAQIAEPQEALAGFSSSATWTIAGLFIVARAVQQHAGLEALVHLALGKGVDDRRALMRLVTPVIALSSVIANTPLVATLAPIVREGSERSGRSASTFLMPLSFAAILGGVITTIGTSTTLVVSGIVEEAGLDRFSVFEVLPLGLPIALIGGILLVVTAPSLLPDRRSSFTQLSSASRDYTFRLQVLPSDSIQGLTVEQAHLRGLESVYLASITRPNHGEITPVPPETVLVAYDILTFVGEVDHVIDLAAKPGLIHAPDTQAASLEGDGHHLFEVVLGSNSALVGSTPKEASFRGRYGAAIVAVHRQGRRVDGKIGDLHLAAGDALVLMSDRIFKHRWEDANDFAVIVELGATQSEESTRRWFVLSVTGIMVLTAAAGMNLLVAVLGSCALLIGSRSLRFRDARASVDVDVLIIVASAIGLGSTLESSGLAGHLSNLVAALAEAAGGGMLALLILMIGTLVLTEAITNVAAAALMVPIALEVGTSVGGDPRGYAVAVAVMASSSFLTPIGYQTNTIVYGLGGYRFSDYWRLGAPLTITALIVTTVVTPLIWS